MTGKTSRERVPVLFGPKEGFFTISAPFGQGLSFYDGTALTPHNEVTVFSDGTLSSVVRDCKSITLLLFAIELRVGVGLERIGAMLALAKDKRGLCCVSLWGLPWLHFT